MDAREYLGQLKKLRNQIEQAEDYLRDKRFKSIGGSATGDAERVQTSPRLDGPYNAIIEIVDLEKEIEAKMVRYNFKWREINETINKLNNTNYSRLLYLYWVRDERMNDVAKIMHFHPKSMSRLHKEALNELQKILDNS